MIEAVTSETYLLAFVLGASVGFAELLSSYKDSPRQALLTAPALGYLLLNGGASVLAVWLLVTNKVTFGFPDGSAAIGPTRALVAGFAATAILRSSIFTVRVGTTQVHFGPTALLDAIRSEADRAASRVTVRYQGRMITQALAGLDWRELRKSLPPLCLGLVGQVSAEDQQALAHSLQSLDSSDISDAAKRTFLGIALLHVVGETAFLTAVEAVRSESS
jgi:hypothetical protein